MIQLWCLLAAKELTSDPSVAIYLVVGGGSANANVGGGGGGFESNQLIWPFNFTFRTHVYNSFSN